MPGWNRFVGGMRLFSHKSLHGFKTGWKWEHDGIKVLIWLCGQQLLSRSLHPLFLSCIYLKFRKYSCDLSLNSSLLKYKTRVILKVYGSTEEFTALFNRKQRLTLALKWVLNSSSVNLQFLLVFPFFFTDALRDSHGSLACSLSRPVKGEDIYLSTNLEGQNCSNPTKFK